MSEIVFDLEADGLLDEATTIYCVSSFNIDTGDKISLYGKELNSRSVRGLLGSGDVVIGHNIISYDLPMLDKFFKVDIIGDYGNEVVIDTLLWSKVLHPDRQLPKGCPTTIRNEYTGKNQKVGPHGLESWGYRVGVKKVQIDRWDVFNSSIVQRCEDDVEINYLTYLALCKEAGFDKRYDI